MSHEYNNEMSGSSCSYANLGSYNQGYSMNIAPQGKQSSGAYVVPTWSPIGYNDLSGPNGVASCSGYGTINDAYSKAKGGKCQTTYTTSLCSPK